MYNIVSSTPLKKQDIQPFFDLGYEEIGEQYYCPQFDDANYLDTQQFLVDEYDIFLPLLFAQ